MYPYQKIKPYIRLMRWDKPIGICLLLWPTLMALWIAGEGKPDIRMVIIFISGVIVMRSAGCVINDMADRQFDEAVSRTRTRPLATGEISVVKAGILFSALLLSAFLLVLQLNSLTFKLSFIGLLLAVIYPFMKRYTHWPQAVLGLAFGWAVPMAFAALTNQITASAWLLYLITGCWSLVYDTQYAMVDKEEDMKVGIKSTALLFGDAVRIVTGTLQTAMLLLLIKLGLDLKLSQFYYVGLTASAMLMLYQQYLMKNNSREYWFKAFLNNNLLGAILFTALFLHYARGA